MDKVKIEGAFRVMIETTECFNIDGYVEAEKFIKDTINVLIEEIDEINILHEEVVNLLRIDGQGTKQTALKKIEKYERKNHGKI